MSQKILRKHTNIGGTSKRIYIGIRVLPKWGLHSKKKTLNRRGFILRVNALNLKIKY